METRSRKMKFTDLKDMLKQSGEAYADKTAYMFKTEKEGEFDTIENLVERTSVRLNKDAKNIEKIAIVETYSVGNTVKEMYKALIKYKKFTFNKLFSPKKRNKKEVVTAFSGLLEMSRRNKVITEQEELFGDIEVEKNKTK